MSDLTFTTGDTAPPIVGALTDSSGAVLDLSAADEVRFQMRLEMDRRFIVDAEAEVTGASAGAVRYDWQPGDLALAGEYISRWQVTWSDETSQRTIPGNTITVQPA